MITISFQQGYPTQSTDFTIDNQTFTIRVKWNQRFSFWSMSLYNRESALIIGGIRLVENTPLIGFLSLKYFDGDFFFVRNYGDKTPPDFDAIGGDFSLIYLRRNEINELVSEAG